MYKYICISVRVCVRACKTRLVRAPTEKLPPPKPIAPFWGGQQPPKLKHSTRTPQEHRSGVDVPYWRLYVSWGSSGLVRDLRSKAKPGRIRGPEGP